MDVAIGQARGAELVGRLASFGFWEMTQPKEWPPRRLPYILDNYAFGSWKAGKPFDEASFTKAVEAARGMTPRPRWIVAPDIVAGGLRSLDLSLAWLPLLIDVAPVYLVVQDGMTPDDVLAASAGFDGFFVGGSLEWKLRTAKGWVGFAHALDKPCHVGRVGTPNRVRWAKRIGADSIDSCLPLWSEDNLQAFLRALNDERQMGMTDDGDSQMVRVRSSPLPPPRAKGAQVRPSPRALLPGLHLREGRGDGEDGVGD